MAPYPHAICPCCEYAAGGSVCHEQCIWAGRSNTNLFAPVRPTKAERKEAKEKKYRKRQKAVKKNTRDYENLRRHARALPK